MVEWKNIRITEGTLLDIKSTISFAISAVVDSPNKQIQESFSYGQPRVLSPKL